MPVLKLTQSMFPQVLQCPEGKNRIELCDADYRGLYIEVRATAPFKGTWYLRYKNDSGVTAHFRLGTYASYEETDLVLSDARKQATARKAEIALGVNPKQTLQGPKVAPIFSTFMENHYLVHVRSRKRSWASDESLYRNYLKDEFGTLRLDQISRQQIQLFHTKLRIERGLAPATADHGIKLLKHALNLAMDWDMLELLVAV